MSEQRPPRRLGQYYRSGDWSDYWQTEVSYVGPEKLLIRGYPIDEIIENLGFAETLYLTIRGELPTREQARVLDAALSSIPAHQWVAAHLLAAAVTASAFPESPIPGIASGILTMGSVTVSPQAGAELVEDVLNAHDGGATLSSAAHEVVERYLAERRLIPGLGHPNHKGQDPRATGLANVARENGMWGLRCEAYTAVRTATHQLTGKDLPINIDGMLSCVLGEIGFSSDEMAGVAAIAAMPGIVAHVIEEHRSGVPLRIVPEELGSKYVGPAERHIDRTKGD